MPPGKEQLLQMNMFAEGETGELIVNPDFQAREEPAVGVSDIAGDKARSSQRDTRPYLSAQYAASKYD